MVAKDNRILTGNWFRSKIDPQPAEDAVFKAKVNHLLNQFNSIPNEFQNECVDLIQKLIANYQEKKRCTVIEQNELNNRSIQCLDLLSEINQKSSQRHDDMSGATSGSLNLCPSCNFPAVKGLIEKIDTKKNKKRIYNATIECKKCLKSYHQNKQCAGVNVNCAEHKRATWICKECDSLKTKEKEPAHLESLTQTVPHPRDQCPKCTHIVVTENYDEKKPPIECTSCKQLYHRNKTCAGVRTNYALDKRKVWKCEKCKSSPLISLRKRVNNFFSIE